MKIQDGMDEEIRDFINESSMCFDSNTIGKATIGSVGNDTINEEKESDNRVLDRDNLEDQFNISADEFNRIVNEGEEIEYEEETNPNIESIIDSMRDDW